MALSENEFDCSLWCYNRHGWWHVIPTADVRSTGRLSAPVKIAATLGILLRGKPHDLREWLNDTQSLKVCVLTIVLGFGMYGLSIGYWRDPAMGLYVAVKMPFLIFITLLCNALLNGMLGLLLGSGLGFRQSLLAQIMSFAVAALLLGSLAPAAFFLATGAPAYANFMVAHILLIAYAGVVANVHLFRLLLECTPSPRIAAITLMSWLAGNAFVGAQFSWILRPFFGRPSLPVAFLREEPMKGTFYESVWKSVEQISEGNPSISIAIAALSALLLLTPLLSSLQRLRKKHDN